MKQKICVSIFFFLLFSCTIKQTSPSSQPDSSFLLSLQHPLDGDSIDGTLMISGVLFSSSPVQSLTLSLSNSNTISLYPLEAIASGGKLYQFQTNITLVKEGIYFVHLEASNQSGQQTTSPIMVITNVLATDIYQTNFIILTNSFAPIVTVGIELQSNAFYQISNISTPLTILSQIQIYSNSLIISSTQTTNRITNFQSFQTFLSNSLSSTNFTYSSALAILSTTNWLETNDLSNSMLYISNLVTNYQETIVSNTWIDNVLSTSLTNLTNWQKLTSFTNEIFKISTNFTVSYHTNHLTNALSTIQTNGLNILSVIDTNHILNQQIISNLLTNSVLAQSFTNSENSTNNLFHSETIIGKVHPQWTQSGNIYTLSANNFVFKVDASASGRITEYSYNGHQAIVQGTGEHQGSTFWSSPQSVWNWPPPAKMDSNTNSYQASLISNNTVLVLTSDPISETGLVQIKRFYSAPESNKMILTYTLSNFTSSNISASAWEVTRVDKSSLIYLPKESSFTGSSEFSPTTETPTNCWYSNNATWKKGFRDGAEHWIAVYRSGFVFIKNYQTNTSQTKFAPGESEIEIYAGDNYFEVEEQSKYQTLATSDTLSWKVVWTILQVPTGTDTSEGSTNLFNWTRNQAANL